MKTALDFDIAECDFWNMTPAELTRVFESKRRVAENQKRERAHFDYSLAVLLSYSFHNPKQMPSITSAYPGVFGAEEAQKQNDDITSMRFRQFAHSYTKRFTSKEVAKE